MADVGQAGDVQGPKGVKKQDGKNHDAGEERASASTGAVDRAQHVEGHELDVTEDGMRLLREMEEEDQMVRQEQDRAAQEYQQLQDSQEREDLVVVAHQQALADAGAYREWEAWAMWGEMGRGASGSTSGERATVTLQGTVDGRQMQRV